MSYFGYKPTWASAPNCVMEPHLHIHRKLGVSIRDNSDSSIKNSNNNTEASNNQNSHGIACGSANNNQNSNNQNSNNQNSNNHGFYPSQMGINSSHGHVNALYNNSNNRGINNGLQSEYGLNSSGYYDTRQNALNHTQQQPGIRRLESNHNGVNHVNEEKIDNISNINMNMGIAHNNNNNNNCPWEFEVDNGDYIIIFNRINKPIIMGDARNWLDTALFHASERKLAMNLNYEIIQVTRSGLNKWALRINTSTVHPNNLTILATMVYNLYKKECKERKAREAEEKERQQPTFYGFESSGDIDEKELSQMMDVRQSRRRSDSFDEYMNDSNNRAHSVDGMRIRRDRRINYNNYNSNNNMMHNGNGGNSNQYNNALSNQYSLRIKFEYSSYPAYLGGHRVITHCYKIYDLPPTMIKNMQQWITPIMKSNNLILGRDYKCYAKKEGTEWDAEKVIRVKILGRCGSCKDAIISALRDAANEYYYQSGL